MFAIGKNFYRVRTILTGFAPKLDAQHFVPQRSPKPANGYHHISSRHRNGHACGAQALESMQDY